MNSFIRNTLMVCFLLLLSSQSFAATRVPKTLDNSVYDTATVQTNTSSSNPLYDLLSKIMKAMQELRASTIDNMR